MDKKTSDELQAISDYVAKLKNNGDLEALSLKQRFKCYGVIDVPETDDELHKVNLWLKTRNKKNRVSTLKAGQTNAC